MKSCLSSIKIFLISGVLLLASCQNPPDPGDAECHAYAADGVEVSCLTLKQKSYVVVRVDLNAARIKLLWKNPAGVPYGSLGEAHRQGGGGLLALTNAGIYSANHAPEGLHVEEGVTLRPLNLKDGGGNFYWKPNGVFYVTDDGAGIVESEKFGSVDERGGVREATQSGPLLVMDGEVNHNLKPDSRSLYARNGIGVKSAGEVYSLVSQDEVSLHEFASVFTEQLRCRSALYLDGCVSQLYLPGRDSYAPERRRCEKELAGMLGVVKRE